MNSFEIMTGNVNRSVAEMQRLNGSLSSFLARVGSVKLEGSLANLGLRVSLKAVESNIRENRQGLNSAGQVLADILKEYKSSESRILAFDVGAQTGAMDSSSGRGVHDGQASRDEDSSVSHYEIDSIVFDDTGSYGGDQGHMDWVYKWDPIRCWEVLKWLKSYYPGINIITAFAYFEHLNQHGCGYVAFANTIFMKYAGREKEFERTFGFPMYKGKDLNYDRLILDIYCKTDQADIHDCTDPKHKHSSPAGVNENVYDDIAENYLNQYGVDVDYKDNVTVTPQNVEQILKNNDGLVLGYRNGNIYDENNQVVQYIDGGHAMTITGVTDDGRYIVSSWGRKYYIPANEAGADYSFMTFNYS